MPVTPSRTVSRDNFQSNVFMDGLIWGTAWDFENQPTREITYSFDNGSLMEEWSEQSKDFLRTALEAWENVANIKFKEVPFSNIDDANNPADIVYVKGSSTALGDYFDIDDRGLGGFHDTPGSTSYLYVKDKTDNSNAPLVGAFSTSLDGWFDTTDSEAFHVLLHEIGHGLGLAHPHDEGGESSIFPGVTSPFDDLGTDKQNTGAYTIMSYNIGYGGYNGAHSNTPMSLDIAAIQAIYGANANYANENNTYRLDPSWAGDGWRALWDTGGVDLITHEGSDNESVIDLRPADLTGSYVGGRPSFNLGAPMGDFMIPNGVIIENATGGNAKDEIYGNDAANILKGNRGNDFIEGFAGNDIIEGGLGNDTIVIDEGSDFVDGDAGFDIVRYRDTRQNYDIASYKQTIIIINNQENTIDHMVAVERFEWQDAIRFRWNVENFDLKILHYIASYADLTGAFGRNQDAAFDHYVDYGFHEGRQISFTGLEYIASYADLINAFGSDETLGLNHYLDYGHAEQRKTSFNALEYIASYDDLMQDFGADVEQGAAHYIQSGYAAGRTTTFNALAYIASYSDLILAFGANEDLGATHYIEYGLVEDRKASFSALEYIASYDDLIETFGTNEAAGYTHFISYGFREQRTANFDSLQYIASHADLIEAFGANKGLGASHYIQYGHREERQSSFSAQDYLDANTDLAAHFGTNYEAATEHYINWGFDEGRAIA